MPRPTAPGRYGGFSYGEDCSLLDLEVRRRLDVCVKLGTLSGRNCARDVGATIKASP
jgi:hypothetical protein